MIVQRIAATTFTVEFENEQELRDEHRLNLSFGALRLPAPETVALHSLLQITLRGPWAGEIQMEGRVVAALPDGIAVAFERDPDEILAALLERPEEDAPAEEQLSSGKSQNSWERVRSLSQMEKILLAAKADRTERALLIQDNDPRVLLSILRNPRLTIEEVARLAKSPFLTYQIADVIMQTGHWMGNLEVRMALIYNPKTPQAFSLRILPTLPDSEVRNIARGGMSMALKQAALRRLQSKT
ncbi:MAG TPA: hypothetical protein VFL80_11025 [Thermoanaerobaculia bacterium]|nr:hypothetical protein [Thermoanaerobaculia bacterium]